MTPAVVAAKKAKINFALHEYEHDPNTRSFGLEAAEKLGLPPDRVFKTLIVMLDGKTLAMAILPVDAMLNLKRCAAALGVKKAAMADGADAERATGYVMGGISPLGQKKRLAAVIDDSVKRGERVYVSGGRRGLDLELAPADLVRLLNAKIAAIVA